MATALQTRHAGQLPLFFAGRPMQLRPSIACAERLEWFEHDRIDQLTACYRRGECPLELLTFAKSENPARIAEMRRQLAQAIRWETARYGDSAVIPHQYQEAA